MKLLIVDDEELTRTGVISSIDWKSLGIDEILQADDGINGLEAARLHKPEIILCDVRMPRMDGISMLSRLESLLPDSIPIFMSGYSDKEYLKAAIRLKAVNYIEKPLNPAEIREAVQEAAELYRQKLRTHRGETLHSMETASRLALQLAAPFGSNRQDIQQLTAELSLNIQPDTCFTAIVVKVHSDLEPSLPSMEEIYFSIRDYLHHFHLECIYAEKRVQYLVFFVFGASMPSEPVLKGIREFICRQFAVCHRFYIAAGENLPGISRAYQSYTSAVVLLQSSFFFPAGTFLTPPVMEELRSTLVHPPLPADPEKLFSELLLAKDEAGCTDFLNTIYACYDRNPGVLPNQAKDLYYKLFRTLDDTAKQLQFSFSSEQETLTATLENSFSYEELHNRLTAKALQFFTDMQNTVQENSTIFLIKDYIGKNYMSETLSVKDISSHVFLSASYVCTFFKNETGMTLNQYLTEYRMEKAKQLLGDSRYKITDISSKVGYSDGNYFGKSFKKYTGFSPSEYREKLS